MEWKDWIGKIVFVKLTDGSVYSKSLVRDYDDGFISITDKFNYALTIAVSQIVKIVEDDE